MEKVSVIIHDCIKRIIAKKYFLSKENLESFNKNQNPSSGNIVFFIHQFKDKYYVDHVAILLEIKDNIYYIIQSLPPPIGQSVNQSPGLRISTIKEYLKFDSQVKAIAYIHIPDEYRQKLIKEINDIASTGSIDGKPVVYAPNILGDPFYIDNVSPLKLRPRPPNSKSFYCGAFVGSLLERIGFDIQPIKIAVAKRHTSYSIFNQLSQRDGCQVGISFLK